MSDGDTGDERLRMRERDGRSESARTGREKLVRETREEESRREKEERRQREWEKETVTVSHCVARNILCAEKNTAIFPSTRKSNIHQKHLSRVADKGGSLPRVGRERQRDVTRDAGLHGNGASQGDVLGAVL